MKALLEKVSNIRIDGVALLLSFFILVFCGLLWHFAHHNVQPSLVSFFQDMVNKGWEALLLSIRVGASNPVQKTDGQGV